MGKASPLSAEVPNQNRIGFGWSPNNTASNTEVQLFSTHIFVTPPPLDEHKFKAHVHWNACHLPSDLTSVTAPGQILTG